MKSPFEQTPQLQLKNWLVESILVNIFCCLPFGIAGIVYASQVNSKFTVGDYAGAITSSLTSFFVFIIIQLIVKIIPTDYVKQTKND